ncbi:MAG: cobalamin-dependent protein [Planctomycetaceae bacterium]
MTLEKPSQRVLLAKVGLDGHDRGIKVVARGLRNAGFHVIYSGLWQSIDAVVQAVRDEDVDWIGVSMLNGAHMTLVPQLLEALKKQKLEHVGVLVGESCAGRPAGIDSPGRRRLLRSRNHAIDAITGFLNTHAAAPVA